MLYLLHSTVPVGGTGSNSARHYLGWCQENGLARRLRQHRTGTKGAALTRAFRQAGGTLLLARTWPMGDRTLERRIKRQHNLPRWCPLCNPDGPLFAVLGLRLRPSSPALGSRSIRPAKAISGASQPGSPTWRSGAYQAVLNPAPGTSCDGLRDEAGAASGGTPSNVGAPLGRSAGRCAGTKLLPSSPGGTQP